MRYRLLEHTADALVEVHGATLEERFENAAYALFDQITDASTIVPRGEVEVSVSADSREQLLVDFLQELLFLHDTPCQAVGRERGYVSCTRVQGCRIEARAALRRLR
jgi:SHS2 domain-containing protein